MQALTVTVIQTTTHWHDPVANRHLFDHWFQSVSSDSDLVVLPEMFSTGFTMATHEVGEPMEGATVSWLKKSAVRLDKTLCGSLIIEDRGRHFNRLLWVTPGGEIATYDKRHLFRMAEEDKYYTPGCHRLVVTLGAWRICPLICYDLRFPVWFRNRDDYDVFLCVANWPAARQMAWNSLLRARAIENLCYVVGVNRVGLDGNNVLYRGGTALYDYGGEPQLEVFDDEGVFETTLDLDALRSYREVFPAWQDADEFRLVVGK